MSSLKIFLTVAGIGTLLAGLITTNAAITSVGIGGSIIGIYLIMELLTRAKNQYHIEITKESNAPIDLIFTEIGRYNFKLVVEVKKRVKNEKELVNKIVIQDSFSKRDIRDGKINIDKINKKYELKLKKIIEEEKQRILQKDNRAKIVISNPHSDLKLIEMKEELKQLEKK